MKVSNLTSPEGRLAVSRATEAITGRKFCTACQREQAPDGGRSKTMANGRVRWVCAGCVSRWKSNGGGK